MLFVMSDIHGYNDVFEKRLSDLNNLETVKDGKDKLILLGDYIDRGPDSYKVLQKIYDIQKECGTENVIVLRGNHEELFLEFLEKKSLDWLGEDEDFHTSRTFLTQEQVEIVTGMATMNSRKKRYEYVRQCIRENHRELLNWLKRLPYFYRNDTQIFVHAGVDEDAGDWWDVGTPDYMFVGKYPPTIGEFYMDVIVGHTATSSVIGEDGFCDVFHDGFNHYFVDGGVERSGHIPVLVYDEGKKKYYSLEGNLKEGRLKPVRCTF